MMLNTIISKQFRIIQKIGTSALYDVFKAINTKNQILVAIKMQKRSISQSKLFDSAKIIKEIEKNINGDSCIPQIIETGTEGDYNYMIMDLLGRSVECIKVQSGGRIQIKLAVDLVEQMIERVQFIHEQGYVHRNLRPQHFLLGRVKRPNKLYITGFHCAKKYLRIDKRHAPYKDNKHNFTGTARYVSINTQMGIQQSRRDDIESIIYILIYILKGELPWQKAKGNDRTEKYDNILELKLATPISILCEGLPQAVAELLDYARTMEYQDTPNYQFIKKKLSDSLKQQTLQP